MSWTKKELYQQIEFLRRKCHIDTYPFNVVNLIQTKSKYIEVEISDFSKRSLCGMLLRTGEYATIMLNVHRTASQRNFDCAHELIHYVFHPDAGSIIICDDAAPMLDPYIEWQANEGASELLMPHRQFITRIAELVRNDGPVTRCPGQYERTRDYFGVTDAMMEVRLKSLRYEMWQYLDGVPVEDITILSDASQRERGITPPVYSYIDARPAVKLPFLSDDMRVSIIDYFGKRKSFMGYDVAMRRTNERFGMNLSMTQYRLLVKNSV